MEKGYDIVWRQWSWEAGIQDEGKYNPKISSCRIDFRGTPHRSVTIRTISSREMRALTMGRIQIRIWTDKNGGVSEPDTDFIPPNSTDAIHDIAVDDATAKSHLRLFSQVGLNARWKID